MMEQRFACVCVCVCCQMETHCVARVLPSEMFLSADGRASFFSLLVVDGWFSLLDGVGCGVIHISRRSSIYRPVDL